MESLRNSLPDSAQTKVDKDFDNTDHSTTGQQLLS